MDLRTSHEHAVNPAAQLGCGMPVVSHGHADDKTH
jgi:hypothetical protein